MLTIAALATVFGWAFFSFWSAIPTGIALDVSPWLVALTVTVSYGSGAALVAFGGAALRERIRRRTANRRDDQQPNRTVQAVRGAWDRFGLVGLALLAPMTVGAQAGAVIGLGFGAHPLRLVIAMTLGAALWSVALTLAVVTGVMAVTG